MENTEKTVLKIKSLQQDFAKAREERDRIKKMHDQITGELEEANSKLNSLEVSINVAQEILIQSQLS